MVKCLIVIVNHRLLVRRHSIEITTQLRKLLLLTNRSLEIYSYKCIKQWQQVREDRLKMLTHILNLFYPIIKLTPLGS